MKASIALPVSLCVALLLVNFAFDWWRHSEAERERASLHDQLAESRRALDEYRALDKETLRTLVARLDALDDAFSRLTQHTDRLLALLPQARDARDDAPASDPETEDAEASEREDLVGALNESAETMRETILSVRHDEWLMRHSSNLKTTDPKKWDPNALLDEFSAQFGVTLSPAQRMLLREEIEVYRSLTRLARARYDFALQSSTVDRIQTRDYEDSDAQTGHFVPDPAIEDREVFASSQAYRWRMRWTRSKFPEEYRQSLSGEYVPTLLAMRLTDLFTSGGLSGEE